MAVRLRDVCLAGCMRRLDLHLPLMCRVSHHVLFQWLGNTMPLECGTRQEPWMWFSRRLALTVTTENAGVSDTYVHGAGNINNTKMD